MKIATHQFRSSKSQTHYHPDDVLQVNILVLAYHFDFNFNDLDHFLFFFFLVIRRPPISPLFPYTTLFRSRPDERDLRAIGKEREMAPAAKRGPVHRQKCIALHAAAMEIDRGATCGDRPHHRVAGRIRSEEHTSELQSQSNLVCRLLLEKKK